MPHNLEVLPNMPAAFLFLIQPQFLEPSAFKALFPLKSTTETEVQQCHRYKYANPN